VLNCVDAVSQVNFKANGEFEKLKARQVAGGHQHDRTVDEKKGTSFSTIATTSVMKIPAIAAVK